MNWILMANDFLVSKAGSEYEMCEQLRAPVRLGSVQAPSGAPVCQKKTARWATCTEPFHSLSALGAEHLQFSQVLKVHSLPSRLGLSD